MADVRRRAGSAPFAATWLVLVLVAGLVLAASWFVPWPRAVVAGAVAVGLLTLGLVWATAFQCARRDDGSFVTAFAGSVREGFRFLRDFL